MGSMVGIAWMTIGFVIIIGMIYNLNLDHNEIMKAVFLNRDIDSKLNRLLKMKRRSAEPKKVSILASSKVKTYKVCIPIQLEKAQFVDIDEVKHGLFHKLENKIIDNMEFLMEEDLIEDKMKYYGLIRIVEVQESENV